MNLPSFGRFNIFVYAVMFAIIVWLLGVVGSLILKDVAKPSPSTLAFALVGAGLLAGLTLIPAVMEPVRGVIGRVDQTWFPLVGAVIGYAIKR